MLDFQWFLHTIRQFRAVERATERDYTRQMKDVTNAYIEANTAGMSPSDSEAFVQEAWDAAERETGRQPNAFDS